ncbi:hypothetical protein E2C01_028820 [Portunus trituberculatus]|uniref:Uncharacterized protein n=1 Tax=Portunus trituberculatus TaxID=210409 RepID=A0A5B7EQ32_PORTR|nr:hypothetical protein [Portunus trituberculatus]
MTRNETRLKEQTKKNKGRVQTLRWTDVAAQKGFVERISQNRVLHKYNCLEFHETQQDQRTKFLAPLYIRTKTRFNHNIHMAQKTVVISFSFCERLSKQNPHF